MKPVIWLGSSREDLREFPESVQDHMGYALYIAQQGGKHRDAKALTGFGGAGVVEVVKDYRGDTFRAVIPCGMQPLSMSFTRSGKNQGPGGKRHAATWS